MGRFFGFYLVVFISVTVGGQSFGSTCKNPWSPTVTDSTKGMQVNPYLDGARICIDKPSIYVEGLKPGKYYQCTRGRWEEAVGYRDCAFSERTKPNQVTSSPKNASPSNGNKENPSDSNAVNQNYKNPEPRVNNNFEGGRGSCDPINVNHMKDIEALIDEQKGYCADGNDICNMKAIKEFETMLLSLKKSCSRS